MREAIITGRYRGSAAAAEQVKTENIQDGCNRESYSCGRSSYRPPHGLAGGEIRGRKGAREVRRQSVCGPNPEIRGEASSTQTSPARTLRRNRSVYPALASAAARSYLLQWPPQVRTVVNSPGVIQACGIVLHAPKQVWILTRSPAGSGIAPGVVSKLGLQHVPRSHQANRRALPVLDGYVGVGRATHG
jgi:hypothetical protein